MQALTIHQPQDATPQVVEPPASADLDDVLELHGMIQKKQLVYDEGKSACKLVRAEIKQLCLQRDRLLGRIRDGQPTFDDMPQAAESAPQPPTEPTAQPADEAWRNELLVDALVGLPKKILDHLHAANMRTVGELAEWTAADGGRHRLIDIPGLRELSAGRIEVALEAFWERRAGR